MAGNNDAELKVGVKLDTTGLKQELQAELSNIFNEVGGVKFFTSAATKDWSQMPFAPAHSGIGNVWATNTLMSGMSKDLQSMGYDKDSSYYQNAMMATGVHNVLPNGAARFGLLSAYGHEAAASMAHPDSEVGRIISNNYKLLNLPFARDFVTDNSVEEPVMKEGKNGSYQARKLNRATGKYEKQFRTVINSEADFQGMRERAVEMGLGKWTDEDKHDASTFEFINEELDKIEERSKKSSRNFSDWGDTLKGVLGTLTAIGGIAAIEHAFEVAYKASEAGVASGATTLDNRRAFVGMRDYDVLSTQLAGAALGFGEDAVFNDIIGLSKDRQSLKILGQDNKVLFRSLSGVFGTIMDEENPFTAYKKALSTIYQDYQSAIPDEKEQMLLLLEGQGLGSMAQIIGAFDNPDIASKYKGILDVFTMKSNPYYGAFAEAEGLNTEIAKLNKSLSASYQALYNTWEEEFGIPFKSWWEEVLQNTIAPTLIALMKSVGVAYNDRKVNKALNNINNIINFGSDSLSYWENNSGIASAYIGSLKAGNGIAEGFSTNASNFLMAKYSSTNKGTTFRAWYDRLKSYADMYDNPEYDDNIGVQRARILVDFYEQHGFDSILSNKSKDAMDLPLLQLGQNFLDTNNMEVLNAFVDKINEGNPVLNDILTALQSIDKKTKEQLFAGGDLQLMIQGGFGNAMWEEVSKTLNR